MTRTQEKKDAVLNLLAKGEGVKTACSILAIGRSTYYKWRKVDEKFRVETDRILSSPEHRERIIMQQSRSEAADESEPREKFMAALRKSGDRSQAANIVNWSATDVEQMLNPESDTYDEELAAAMAEHELRHLWQIEDGAKRKALHDTGMQKFFLTTQLKEKYGKPPERDGGTTNNFWFSAEGHDRAKNVLRQIVDGEYKRLPERTG